VWAKRLHSTAVTVIEGDSPYDDVVATAFRDEAHAIGVGVTSTDQASLGFAAVEASERGRLRELAGIPRVIGTDALLAPSAVRLVGESLGITSAAQDPEQLPQRGQRFLRDFRKRYDREPGPYAAYGYEAMALALQAIGAANTNSDQFRSEVRDGVVGGERRESILGPYSITDAGDSTVCMVQRYLVSAARLQPLDAPCP
jgi:ABC-type branched-subunit amino acid transport system substrate-binding protein